LTPELKNKQTMKKFFLFVGLLLTASITFGQVPNSFNYQAVIRDGDGNLVTNSSVNLRFTITDGTTDFYQETQSATTDAFGTVAVKVGNGIPESGTWSNINWEAAGLGLKTEIQDNSNWIDLGTQEFGSVPFAQKAAQANTSEFADTANFADAAEFADTADFALSSPVAMAYITADNSANTASVVAGYGIQSVSVVNYSGNKYLWITLEKTYTSEPVIIAIPRNANGSQIYTATNFSTSLNSSSIFINLTDNAGNQIVGDCFVVVYFP